MLSVWFPALSFVKTKYPFTSVTTPIVVFSTVTLVNATGSPEVLS